MGLFSGANLLSQFTFTENLLKMETFRN